MNWEHLKKKEGEMIEKTKKVKYGKKKCLGKHNN
jgi:hypothetical protein